MLLEVKVSLFYRLIFNSPKGRKEAEEEAESLPVTTGNNNKTKSGAGSSKKKSSGERRREDLRLTRMMLIIFCCFLLCFLPLMVVNVADDEVIAVINDIRILFRSHQSKKH